MHVEFLKGLGYTFLNKKCLTCFNQFKKNTPDLMKFCKIALPDFKSNSAVVQVH